jgi:hypothetical protein
MPTNTTHDLLSRVERLKALLVERATGGTPDEQEYARLRRELVTLPGLRGALPEVVRQFSTIREFWNFIKPMFETDKYRNRTEYLRQAFAPVLEMLEVSSDSPADAGPSRPPSTPAEHRVAPMIKVLLLSANSLDAPLGIEEEFRAIDARLRASEHRDHVQLIPHGAVRLADIPGLLMRHKPHVVHFSGHGDAVGIELSNGTGESARVTPPDALADIFRVLKDNVRVVVLNACDSAPRRKRSSGSSTVPWG